MHSLIFKRRQTEQRQKRAAEPVFAALECHSESLVPRVVREPMPRLEGGACGHGRHTTKHNRGDVEKISTPHPQNAHQNSTKSHKDEGMCVFWGWGGS